MIKQVMKRYEYPIGDHIGSYTIKDGAKPLHIRGQKLVQVFTMEVLEKHERLNEHEDW